MIVLVDTNILLDVLQRRDPHYPAAERVWKFVEERMIDGFVSAISFNNIFYIARKQAGVDKAMEAVVQVRKVFRIAPLDEQAIDRAVDMGLSDFEDAIQSAAAARVRADYLVTRNVKDFASAGVQAVTADELLALLTVS
jgi:predicted nucleic acid-binding protein